MSNRDDDNPFGSPQGLGGEWLIRTQAPANSNQPPVESEAAPIPAEPEQLYYTTPADYEPPSADHIYGEFEQAPPPPPVAPVVVELPKAQPAEPRKPILVSKDSGLVVKNLGKQYAKRPVVRNVSLSLQRGEAVGLLGPNGAGKTTCFYMITGLVSPDYGSIYMDGSEITQLPMYRRARLGIGYLPQEASIFRGLTVEQNIMAVLEVSENDPGRRRAMCDDLLAEFSITHLRQSPAIALSGGERRRAEIARALAGRPAFILLDEPLAGIDPIAIADVRDLVSHLKDRGIGVLITDHNVRETLDVIDRAYIIHDGTVLMEGSPSDIVNNHEVRRVYLGERFSL
jgi:lipopolysaccharide export system ATP-binding protein